MRLRTRAALVLGLLAVLGWCLLLFGIGLNDLTNNHTKPGVIFSVVMLVILIPAVLYAIWKVARPVVLQRLARR
jgi:hypothetical protein